MRTPHHLGARIKQPSAHNLFSASRWVNGRRPPVPEREEAGHPPRFRDRLFRNPGSHPTSNWAQLKRTPKVLVAARLDKEVYDWLLKYGRGYSTRITASCAPLWRALGNLPCSAVSLLSGGRLGLRSRSIRQRPAVRQRHRYENPARLAADLRMTRDGHFVPRLEQ
jgi:uncharacterized protein (DUF4415 family)